MVWELQIFIEMVFEELLLVLIILQEVVQEVVILAPVERLLMEEEQEELMLAMVMKELPIVAAEVEEVLLDQNTVPMVVQESL